MRNVKTTRSTAYGAEMNIEHKGGDFFEVEVRNQTTDAKGLREWARFLLESADKISGVPAKSKKPRKTLGPQHHAILDHLSAKGSITNVEANAVYRIRSLPRRILDLKEAGYKIGSEMKKDPTGQRYVRYSLAA